MGSVTVRLIAERLLPKGHPTVFVADEITERLIRLPPLTRERVFHLYASPHNASALRLAEEVGEMVEGLRVSARLDTLHRCEHLLV